MASENIPKITIPKEHSKLVGIADSLSVLLPESRAYRNSYLSVVADKVQSGVQILGLPTEYAAYRFQHSIIDKIPEATMSLRIKEGDLWSVWFGVGRFLRKVNNYDFAFFNQEHAGNTYFLAQKISNDLFEKMDEIESLQSPGFEVLSEGDSGEISLEGIASKKDAMFLHSYLLKETGLPFSQIHKTKHGWNVKAQAKYHTLDRTAILGLSKRELKDYFLSSSDSPYFVGKYGLSKIGIFANNVYEMYFYSKGFKNELRQSKEKFKRIDIVYPSVEWFLDKGLNVDEFILVNYDEYYQETFSSGGVILNGSRGTLNIVQSIDQFVLDSMQRKFH